MMKLLLILMVSAIGVLPGIGRAEDAWPSKLITLIVGAPPGGSLDSLARLIAGPLGASLGKTVVVLNRPGGSQVIAKGAVANATDGHTFLLATEGLALNVGLHPEQTDPRADLTPVMLLTRSSLAIAAAPGAPYHTFAELVKEAKRRPGEISYGSSGGTATLSHLLMVMLESSADIKLIHVPYSGGPQALQATMGNQTALAVGTSFLVRSQAESNRVRALAVTSAGRDPSLPGVPSLAEQGFPGFVVYAWWGLLAPKRTPDAIIARMHDELAAVLSSPPIRARLIPQGMEIISSSPSAFREILDTEIARWTTVIKENNVRAGE
jgi:tripartite-type tricarboxylate transporter receptor subunit TctC